jgi:hypothetical protein
MSFVDIVVDAGETCARDPRSVAALPVEDVGRGMNRGTFQDTYNHACYVQESSAAASPERSLWLGLLRPALTVDLKSGARVQMEPSTVASALNADSVHMPSVMHLSQSQVAALLPLLTEFAQTGRIGRNAAQ